VGWGVWGPRVIGAKIRPPTMKIREINSFLVDPLPLQSMETENFKCRYLRLGYLKS